MSYVHVYRLNVFPDTKFYYYRKMQWDFGGWGGIYRRDIVKEF